MGGRGRFLLVLNHSQDGPGVLILRFTKLLFIKFMVFSDVMSCCIVQ
jgi:hypothetical protein